MLVNCILWNIYVFTDVSYVPNPRMHQILDQTEILLAIIRDNLRLRYP